MRCTARGKGVSRRVPCVRIIANSCFHLEWAAYLSNNPENLEEYPEPDANDADFCQHPIFSKLSSDARWSIPDEVEGFKCLDRELMSKIWPEGTEKALQVNSALQPRFAGTDALL